MDLGFSETQHMLRNAAREFLQQECPRSFVREMEQNEMGYTLDLWKKIADMGWLGLVFPEEYGGVGEDFVSLCIVIEEMGRALFPGPFFSSVVLTGLPISEYGTDVQRSEFLPRIADGNLVATLALNERGSSYDPPGVQLEARSIDSGFVLNGVKGFVENANSSSTLLVAARTQTGSATQGITLFLVPARASGLKQDLLDISESRKESNLIFRDVLVTNENILGDLHGGWAILKQIIQWGAVAKCAEMIGQAEAVLEMTVEYVKQRVQFGRPIGSFQAIQDHCTDMAINLKGARNITYQAAWRLSQGLPSDLSVAYAKSWVSDAVRHICDLSHQSHGAVAFTREYDLYLYVNRVKTNEVAFGDGYFHREKVAQLLSL
jgi:alkylation response protein AidB-like acyl-CoA dehydrogenase